MKNILMFLALFQHIELFAQLKPNFTIQGEAQVPVVNTGDKVVINFTQVYLNWPEYQELKREIESLNAEIYRKGTFCAEIEKEGVSAKLRNDCRNEVVVLNTRLDSLKIIMVGLQTNVHQLDVIFNMTRPNTSRLRLAKQYYFERKIEKAYKVLDEKKIKDDGEILLAMQLREGMDRKATDSILQVFANELILKAELKSLDFRDPFRYDSIQTFFDASTLYHTSIENLWMFGEFLYYQGELNRSEYFLKKALNLSHSENEKGKSYVNLGIIYGAANKIEEARGMYLNSLNIFEHLFAIDSLQYAPDLALVCLNIGVFFKNNGDIPTAKIMYHRSLKIYEDLAKTKPSIFEPYLAKVAMDLGVYYHEIKDNHEAKNMYSLSLECYERLVKEKPGLYEGELAKLMMNFGLCYKRLKKPSEAEQMFQQSFDLYQQLIQKEPTKYKADFALLAENFGSYYRSILELKDPNNMTKEEKVRKGKKMFQYSLENFEELANGGSDQFSIALGNCCMDFANFCISIGDSLKAEQLYKRSFTIFEPLAKSNPLRYELNFAKLCTNFAIFYQAKPNHKEAEKLFRISIEVYEEKIKTSLKQFALELSITYGNLSWSLINLGKFAEATNVAEKCLATDSSQNWVRTYLGHSWLLRHKWKKAKAIYEQYITIEATNTVESKALISKDLDDLNAAGITCREMIEARRWLSKH